MKSGLHWSGSQSDSQKVSRKDSQDSQTWASKPENRLKEDSNLCKPDGKENALTSEGKVRKIMSGREEMEEEDEEEEKGEEEEKKEECMVGL